MTKIITLDENYSTTRLVTKEKPEIVNKPEKKFETLLFLPEGEGRRGEGGLRTQGYFKKSYDGKPLISVITVVYNGEKYLEETIQSIIHQTYDYVSYKIAGDYELLLRKRDNLRTFYFNSITAKRRNGGVSNCNINKVFAEMLKAKLTTLNRNKLFAYAEYYIGHLKYFVKSVLVRYGYNL